MLQLAFVSYHCIDLFSAVFVPGLVCVLHDQWTVWLCHGSVPGADGLRCGENL